MMNSLDNPAIAEALGRREPEAIAALYAAYQTGLFRYLCALTRDRDFAEDLSQETWLRVVERGSLYTGDRSFESWLFTVARHVAIDEWRRWDNRVSRSKRDDDDGACRRETLACRRPSPSKLAEDAETSRRLGAAVRCLPVRLQTVVRLRVIEDLNLDQVADRAGIPCGTVKSRMHRGIALLRHRLAA